MLLFVMVMTVGFAVWGMTIDYDNGSQFASAENSYEKTMQPSIPVAFAQSDVTVDLKTPQVIMASEIVPIDVTVTDGQSFILTHVDWAIVVTDPLGNTVYKTTTAHSHAGKMNFQVAFPTAGENKITLSASSIGPKMMGMDVPEKARTHTALSGIGPKGWTDDPLNDFGSRVFEFPVIVLPQSETKIVTGSNESKQVNVELMTTSNKITAGVPSTLVITATQPDGSMINHVDGRVVIRHGEYAASRSSEPGNPMMPMNGAYHGHVGVLTQTMTFPTSGNYIVHVNLNTLGVSNYQFGMASATFVVNVSAPDSITSSTESVPKNTVHVVGLEAPFFSPNSINVSAGTSVTFDNVDANLHTVTSVESGSKQPNGIFDSGLLKANEKFTVTFDEPGEYEYFCALHTNMKGTVIVS